MEQTMTPPLTPLQNCRTVRIDTSTHTVSSSHLTPVFYSVVDGGVMICQRFLLCILVLLGCDIYMSRAGSDSESFTLSSTLVRITRNCYFILRGLRKWLAIHFNDGVIPMPAVQPVRPIQAFRSTPKSNAPNGDCLQNMARCHSPIQHCYSTSGEPIPFFKMLAGATPHKMNLEHSDPLSESSTVPSFDG